MTQERRWYVWSDGYTAHFERLMPNNGVPTQWEVDTNSASIVDFDHYQRESTAAIESEVEDDTFSEEKTST